MARISAGLLLAFAVCLQIQITLFATDGYIGLRANMGDLLLPFAGLFIAGSLLLKRSQWPRWQSPFGYWAPILLSVIVGLAIFNGFLVQGEWSSWAVFNKGVGWAVLMAYLLAGAWFGTNRPEIVQRWFILPFAGFVAIITLAEGLYRGAYHAGPISSLEVFGYTLGRDLAGLMVNRNAFAFLYLCALILGSLQMAFHPALNRIQKWAYAALWFLLPLFLLLNLSRASVLVLIPLALYLLITQRRMFLRLCLPLAVAGLLLVPLANFDKVKSTLGNVGKVANVQAQIEHGDALAYEKSVYLGDQVRLQIIQDSWTLIQNHPLTGAGIGTALKIQHDEERQLISVIDNTALWILTEMGPFGFLGFASVYVCMLIALMRRARGGGPEEQAFIMGAVLMLLCFGIYSLLHEIIYTRFFWFILGLSLAAPIARQTQ